MTSFQIYVGSNTCLASWHDSNQQRTATFQKNTTVLPWKRR